MTKRFSGDIAIVGMAGLFAKAPDARTFWSNILNQVDAVDDPLPEWGAARFYDPDSDDLTRIYTYRGGFLNELSRFDPRRFAIMPNSLSGSEPDHYHALDLALNALEDAGMKRGEYAGENIGVILGHGIHAHRGNTNGIQHALGVHQTVELLYSLFPHLGTGERERLKRLVKSSLPPIDVDSVPGLVPNAMTGRIANRLDLMGPNYIIDAACASSLIAVESAMLELQRGRADVMLAGGINTTTSPLVYGVFCGIGALSRTSRIRPFDRGADGTLLGEGGGILVLKRKEDALSAGDRIYALLKGVGQSSDGRGKGVMAPRLEGEYLAMQRAYRETGVDPASIGLLEAHGTGIPLGDKTEIGAMARIWGERTRPYPNIALGSVKSMIGHCIPGAGIASIIKMSLALHQKVLPPTLCDEVNTDLGLDKLPFYVNTETRPWQHQGRTPRRAAVNAFGFGGVNSHAILEEAPGADADPTAAFTPQQRRGTPQLFLLTATDRDDLLAAIHALGERLDASDVDLHRLAEEQWRSAVPDATQRLALIADSVTELRAKLAPLPEKLADPARHKLQARNGIYFSQQPLEGKVAFLFPGENSQYTGMLADLALHFPEVRDWFDFLDTLFAGEREFAPTEAVFPVPTGLDDEQRARLRERLHDMELGSESAFCADQALFTLLGRFGVRADAMLGHSTGENAALIASGRPRMDRAAVHDYIRRMNALYRELLESDRLPSGVLMSVGAARLDEVLRLTDADPQLHLTMDNCHNQFILFGDEAAIERAAAELKAQGAICVRLPLARGYHTRQMEPMANAFRELFRGIEIGDSTVELYSCVSAEPFPHDPAGFLETATSQYMSRVRFRESIERMYRDGVRVFVEVGPSSTLSGFVRDVLKGREHLAVSCNDRNRPDLVQLAHLLARLFAYGVSVDFAYWFERRGLAPREISGAYLSTALPVIELDAERAREVHDTLAPCPAPPGRAATATTPGAATHSAPQAAPATPPPVAGNTALQGHFTLMNELLRQQQRMMQRWLAGRTPGSGADE